MTRAPLTRLWGLLLVMGGLGGCGDIPQPFRHDDEVPKLARPKLGMMRGVTVRPPVDGDAGRALATAMVEALGEQDIPATLQSGPAFGHVIEGELAERGPEVAVRWHLKSPDGAEAASQVQTIPKTVLARGEPGLMKRLAAATAVAFSTPLADPDALAQPSAKPAADLRASVMLVPLRGLPGDGDKALAAALRRALERGGVVVKDDGADYVVEGKVTVAPGLANEDTVTVAWVVKRADGGAELGNIGQSGGVPRGRLSQPWGLLARDIAEGGAQGVVEVVLADNGKRRKGR